MYFYVVEGKAGPSPGRLRVGERGQIGLLGYTNETDFIHAAEVPSSATT